MTPVYEDNHLIIVEKTPGEIVQGDKTGDTPLSETLKIWLKEKYNKPGNVFVGVVHRLDRPVGGLVVFAKTSKALQRLNDMFRNGDVDKTYHAIVANRPPLEEGTLENWVRSIEKTNKTLICNQNAKDAKKAVLKYKLIASGEKYHLLEIKLLTGRKHQIRAQLAAMGCPIKGDLKYGAPRSNPDGSISLRAVKIDFIHPVSKIPVSVSASIPHDRLWIELEQIAENNSKNDLPNHIN